MQRLGLARWGLWVFTAGIFAWIFPNASQGNTANVLTDVAIVSGGILAAVGLPRAVEGFGTAPLRWGLAVVALGQFGQNVNTALTGFTAANAAPVVIVILASAAVAVGAKRWQEDGWDPAATPWLTAGFAGFAFEPVYYFVRGATFGDPFGPYFVGSLLVASGAILCALAFRPGGDDPTPEPPASPPKAPKAAPAGKPRGRAQP